MRPRGPGDIHGVARSISAWRSHDCPSEGDGRQAPAGSVPLRARGSPVPGWHAGARTVGLSSPPLEARPHSNARSVACRRRAGQTHTGCGKWTVIVVKTSHARIACTFRTNVAQHWAGRPPRGGSQTPEIPATVRGERVSPVSAGVCPRSALRPRSGSAGPPRPQLATGRLAARCSICGPTGSHAARMSQFRKSSQIPRQPSLTILAKVAHRGAQRQGGLPSRSGGV